MDKTVCFLTTMWNGGASYYRLELPAWALNMRSGWDCVLTDDIQVEPDGSLTGKTTLEDETLEELTSDVDAFITQRWMNHDASDITLRARAAGQKIFADLDDHYWELPLDNPALIFTDPSYNPNYNRSHYWDQLAACDAVICSTPTLEKFLNERIDVPTHLKRNMINLDLWWTGHDTYKAGRFPRIGWTGVTVWRQADLIHLEGAVGEVIKENQLEFVHVGYTEDGPTAASLLNVDNKNVKFQITQMAFDLFPAAMKEAQIDIGIVPLVDTPFNRAKSCIKGMEYAACGIPFVASPTPEYERLGIGILAKTPKDWKKALEKLIDPDFREQKAQEGYNRVKLEDYRLQISEYEGILAQYL